MKVRIVRISKKTLLTLTTSNFLVLINRLSTVVPTRWSDCKPRWIEMTFASLKVLGTPILFRFKLFMLVLATKDNLCF